MRKVIIDSKEIEVDAGLALIQACEVAGAEIPRFCYHDRLSVAGNCRMCLVEVVGAPKPMASCAVTVGDLRGGRDGEPPEIRTNSDLVHKARHGVMEFLLINHPLDCPICDQGGECDLQDQAMAFGGDRSRYALNKRAVEDKEMGPLIKTTMTRCIHCTRCVRFATEVAGVPEIGAIGRGEDMEITTYLEQAVTSELSGNVIDLCPVGALTSKPYAFKSRPWELKKTQSIDVMDALGSHIRVDSRGRDVLRILPRANDWVNEEWLSDKGRFVWDALARQRIDVPYIRRGEHLTPTNWPDALESLSQEIKKRRVYVLAGELASMDTLFAAREFCKSLPKSAVEIRLNGEVFDSQDPSSFTFGAGIAGIDEADGIIMVGSNPRLQAPVLNARIRQRWLESDIPIGLLGEHCDLTYPTLHLGKTAADLDSLVSDIPEEFSRCEKLLVIVSPDALSGANGAMVLQRCKRLAARCGSDDWNGFAVLQNQASMVGGLLCGFTNNELQQKIHDKAFEPDDLVILIGVDHLDRDHFGQAGIVYMGTHGELGAGMADMVLPVAAWTEEDALFANTEGRVQRARKAVDAPGDAREGWKVFRALSQILGHETSYDDHEGLVREMAQEGLLKNSHEYGPIRTALKSDDAWDAMADPDVTLGLKNQNYFMTNTIARASETLMTCARERSGSHGSNHQEQK